MKKNLKCGTHGKRPWNGEVVCSACDRLYTTHDHKLKNHAPEICMCGRPLMPPATDFTARPCCTYCYRTGTETIMKIIKNIERTRSITVEVESGGAVFQATVADHYKSDDPKSVFAGEMVEIRLGKSGPAIGLPIKAWPAVREAIDRAISEFKAAYPESPQ
jgi:hypothetical protein